MAETTDIVTARSLLLRYDHAMLDELVEVTEEWSELGEGERTSWMIDWDQIALQDVSKLGEYAAKGVLTDEQLADYHRLIQRIEQHRDLIKQFGLTMPRIPVES